MSFWDDFFYIPPRENSLWNSLAKQTSNLNLEGVSNTTPGDPEKLATSRRLPVEDIAGVIQNRYRAFNVFDINPFLLQSNQFASQVPFDRIISKVGYEADKSSTTIGNTQYNAGITGWRTVELPSPGTFLKFEFSPTQVNEYINPSIDNNIQNNQKPVGLFGTGGYEVISQTSSRNVFIQFDDTNAPLIAVSHGDVFKIPFERIYVTCKVIVPRFTITTGYNATIETTQTNEKILASDPAFGPGFGLWENKGRHCVPFNCGLNGISETTANFTVLAPNTTDNQNIFNQTGNSAGTLAVPSNIIGFAHIWITGVTLVVSNTNAGAGNVEGMFRIYRGTALNGAGGTKEDLFSMPWQCNTTFALSHTFTNPIRFSLYLGLGSSSQTDRIPFFGCQVGSGSTSAANVRYNYSIQGYTYGAPSPISGGSWSLPAVTDMPFPLDVRFA